MREVAEDDIHAVQSLTPCPQLARTNYSGCYNRFVLVVARGLNGEHPVYITLDTRPFTDEAHSVSRRPTDNA